MRAKPKLLPPVVLMNEVGIVEENREPLLAFLSLLQYHHIPTYEHSVRVANLAVSMAEVADLPDVSNIGTSPCTPV